VVLVSAGDGTTSEGEFFESLNTVCNLKLPVLYLIEDNGYAISVPVEVQTAGGSISKLVSGFPNLYVEEVDGCDPIASYGALKRAVSHCRDRRGPALIHAHVIRPYSHSLSDDERLYRTESERQQDSSRDPLNTFAAFLKAEGLATETDLKNVQAEVEDSVNLSADEAVAAQKPPKQSVTLYVYSPEVDPTSKQFDTESTTISGGDPKTMLDLINACLHDEMARDERIVAFGEDIADCSRETNIEQVK